MAKSKIILRAGISNFEVCPECGQQKLVVHRSRYGKLSRCRNCGYGEEYASMQLENEMTYASGRGDWN